MEINKIKSYLMFSIRSGKIIFGVDKLFVCKKKPLLIIICSTQNEKVTRKVVNFANDNNIKVIKLQNLVLRELIGRDNCKVVGLLDYSLSHAIIKEYQMGNKND